jgi:UDP-2,3-diacylglucosamine pyrophosphatase LpxH
MDISKFEKPLERHATLAEEIEEARYVLLTLRSAALQSRIIYIFGNHDYRLKAYIARNARELNGLRGLSLEEQLDCKELDIDVVNNNTKENFYKYGNILIGHFNKSSKHSGYTAKALLEDKGLSVIQGHTHRLAAIYKRDYDSMKGGWECGCLCELDPAYCNIPNWCQGFCVIHTDKKTGYYHVEEVPIINEKIIYGGKIIR